jgi:hypothetical protein
VKKIARAGEASKSCGRRGGKEPHERRAAFHGGPSPFRHFEAPRVRAGGQSSVQGRGRRRRRREAARAGPEGDRRLPTRLTRRCSRQREGLTRSGGAVPAEGPRLRGLEGNSGGAEAQESSGRPAGETRGRRERTHRGRKAPKRVKLAERAANARSPGQPGSGSRFVEREPIAVGGTRQLRRKRGRRGNRW